MNSIQQSVIKHEIGLLNLATELGNVSRACKVMVFFHDTFYRHQATIETGGIEALIDANRRKPNLKNRVEEAMETAVTAFSLETLFTLSIQQRKRKTLPTPLTVSTFQG